VFIPRFRSHFTSRLGFARARLLLDASILLGTLTLAGSLGTHLSVVRGSSMAPTIRDGDRIMVEPVIAGVERGDVVVLSYPLDPTVDYVKRVIGLPGERVTMAGGRVWVNGEALVESYVEAVDHGACISTRVPEGHYFVLGDNRPRSSDSRDFGAVPMEALRGEVHLKVWPPARVGLVD